MSATNLSPAGQPSKKALICIGSSTGMLGLGNASVALYNLFYIVTGFGGAPMLASAPASNVLDRTLTSGPMRMSRPTFTGASRPRRLRSRERRSDG
jgi:cytochrome c oxidase assembly protein Cox11